MRQFGTLITAMVTPFDAHLQVDYRRAAELARFLVDNGSDSLVVAGTTGESPTLSHEEKLRLFETVKEAVGRRAKVIAGTGTNNTQASIELTKEAEALGMDGILLVGPYYNKPPQRGLYEHFRAIAEATSLPVMLYNIPGRTGRNIEAKTVCALAQDVPNIRGLKEASGDLGQASRILRTLGATVPDFTLFSGNDNDTLPLLAIGGYGVVSVASHVAGPQMKEMLTAFHEGNLKRAAELHLLLTPLFDALFMPSSVNPAPVKAALKLMGMDVGGLRLPLVPLSEEEVNQLRAAMKEVGLL